MKGIEQTRLTGKIGKGFSSVNAYACNRRQPSFEVLRQIADIFK